MEIGDTRKGEEERNGRGREWEERVGKQGGKVRRKKWTRWERLDAKKVQDGNVKGRKKGMLRLLRFAMDM